MSKEVTYDQHPPDREHGPTVLIVDDEKHARDRMEMALSLVTGGNTLHILHALSVSEAHQIISERLVHVVLLDKNLGEEPVTTEANGIESIPEMLRVQPHLQILMVTGSGDIQDVVRAMNLGACGYITKEMPDNLLITHINQAIGVAALKIEKVRRDRTDSGEYELGGSSRIFTAIKKSAEVLAESNRPILMLGETGTGKTELAKWIHHRRGRFLKQKDRPFFGINVATLSRDLIESELFGHEKNAFTDAKFMKQGLFELANHGTLFLDEIGELPVDLQAKLLTVIEEGTFKRVGGDKIMKATPKLIFATNRDLEKMVETGAFREDLRMRISMFPIQMPSLSERSEDIPDLIRTLLPKSCRDNRVQVTFEEIPKDFIDHQMENPVQGNIRGLLNQLDRLLVLSPRDKRGRPVLTHWRTIPGLHFLRRPKASPAAELSKIPLSYEELITRPWNMISSEFPGLGPLLDEVKSRILGEAKGKLRTNRAISKTLGVSESTASVLIKRYEEQSTHSRGVEATQ